MKEKKKIDKKIIVSLFLGISLATGWMTSIRIGKIGISEVLFFFVTSYLVLKNLNYLFNFDKKKLLDYLKIYLLILSGFITPLLTINGSNGGSYLLLALYPYCFLIIILFPILIEKKQISFDLIVQIFSFLFIFILFLNYFIYDVLFLNYSEDRKFSGLSNNPNQLCSYLIYLMLFQALFKKKLFFFFFPIIIFFGLSTKSDAFLFGIFISILIIFLSYSSKIFKKKLFFILSIFISFFLISYILISQKLFFEIFEFFDKDSERFKLLIIYFDEILNKPFFGHGLRNLFSNEAHNMFLDFAFIFGLPFSFLIYFILMSSLLIAILKKDYYLCYSLSLFIFFSFFHYLGRHFIFYVLIGTLIHYLILNIKKRILI